MSTDLGYMWKGERFQIKGSTLNELVSRESCESLDIVQTLRDAGVELPECLDT